jgi:hypothetical protein
MDLLASKGELSPSDLAELKAMSAEELVAFVVAMSKGWYRLLAALEEAHQQDLQELERRLGEQFQTALRTTSASHAAQLSELKTQLSSLDKCFASGLEMTRDNGEVLKRLESILNRLTSESADGP